MAGTKEIKRRIKLVKTTAQITRAMELVAATKMRKAEADARISRRYAEGAQELLSRLAENVKNTRENNAGNFSRLFSGNVVNNFAQKEKREKKRDENRGEGGKTLALVISPDRGLAGALSTNLLREARHTLADIPEEKLEVMAIGKRGRDFFRRAGYRLVAEATRLDWKPHPIDIRPFSRVAIEGFLSGEYTKVMIVYSHFISASSQKPVAKTLLPFPSLSNLPKSEGSEGGEKNFQYFSLIEPSPEIVLETIARNLLEAQIYQALLESNASEHSARMMAMHSATENAKELNDDLTLSYNHIRQESITREIAEISAGAEG